MAPLWQVVGNHGLVIVKTLISIVDLMSWKKAVGVYREDADGAAKVFETVIRTRP